jgi:hypothetical protein
MRQGEWKEGIWLKKGTEGKIIKLNKGSPPRPDIVSEEYPDGLPGTDAWATFQIDGDENAKIAISLSNIKKFKKI